MDTKNTKRGGLVGKLLMAAAAGCLAGTIGVAGSGCSKDKSGDDSKAKKETTEKKGDDKAGAAKTQPDPKAKAGADGEKKGCSGAKGCSGKAEAGADGEKKGCSGAKGCSGKAGDDKKAEAK